VALHLTFDDGPDPVWTPRILDVLDAAGARATFFVLAPSAEREPDLIQRMGAGGHEVALHADRHVRHTELSEAAIAADAEAALGRLRPLGVAPCRWRTPWGAITPATRAVAARLGLRLCGWTLDTHDWRGDHETAMFARIAPVVADGEVVLLHDGLGPGALRTGCSATASLTTRLLRRAGEQGLRVDSLAAARLEAVA
jgi:peptidoglycan/xylan/chitin deacetylase (PgdA/CDA1 family)